MTANDYKTACNHLHELTPRNGQKSFYGRAKVYKAEDGTETLFSYDTPIIERAPDGTLTRLWSGWSATTGKHVIAFCGLHKAEYDKLPTRY